MIHARRVPNGESWERSSGRNLLNLRSLRFETFRPAVALGRGCRLLGIWGVVAVASNVLGADFKLSAGSDGGGTVQLTPALASYPSNSTVSVRAVAAPGWTFLGWLGALQGNVATTSIVMDENKCVRAVFGTPVVTSAEGPGSSTRDPSFPLYPYGSTVRITPIPNFGNHFQSWGNAATGNQVPLPLVVTNPQPVVEATFSAINAGEYTLTVTTRGNGHVTVSPPGTVFEGGQVVLVTAVPDAEEQFRGWARDGSGTSNPLVVVLSTNRVVEAQFTQRPRFEIDPCLCGLSKTGFRVGVAGGLAARYNLQRSSDLEGWTSLATLSNSLGRAPYLDTSATNRPNGFYRVLTLP